MIQQIKNAAHKTLKCFPDYFSFRWPWVLFFGIAVHILIAVVSVLSGWDVRYRSQYEIWSSFIFIVAILALVFYLIYILRFNIFKRFGKLSSWHFSGGFLMYFLSMAMVISWFFTPAMVDTIMTRSRYKAEIVAQDINKINSLVTQIEYDSIPHYWTRDIVNLHKTNDENYAYYNGYEDRIAGAKLYQEIAINEDANMYSEARYDESSLNGSLYQDDARRIFYIGDIENLDSTRFFSEQMDDSIVKINDTSFYRFKCPNYHFVDAPEDFFDFSEIKELSNKEIFLRHIATKKVNDVANVKKELETIIAKYKRVIVPNSYEYYTKADMEKQYRLVNYFQSISDDYNLGNVSSSLGNICEKYYQWQKDLSSMFCYLVYYFGLILALGLFIFRHNHIREFFTTILFGTLLTIATTIFFVVFGIRDGQAILVILLIYFSIFIVITLINFKSKIYSKMGVLSQNISLLILPFVPLMITGIYYAQKAKAFRIKYNGSDIYSTLYEKEFAFEDTAILLSQFAGALLLLIAIHFLYAKFYRRTFALPKE